MEHFEKIIEGFEPLTVFAKRSILNVWQSPEYASTADAYFTLGKKLFRGYSEADISSYNISYCLQ